jgi:hypothetical protein
MGENSEDVPDVLSAEILYDGVRKVCFGHLSPPPFLIG